MVMAESLLLLQGHSSRLCGPNVIVLIEFKHVLQVYVSVSHFWPVTPQNLSSNGITGQLVRELILIFDHSGWPGLPWASSDEREPDEIAVYFIYR